MFIAWDSENFINILCRKQKLQLSKLKCAILQWTLVITATAIPKMWIKTNCMEFILKDECLLNSPDYHILTAMLEMYQCYTSKSTDTYGTKDIPFRRPLNQRGLPD